ncbi:MULTISPECIES: hypothetical protein [Kitasatospora]|uniref:DUF4386 domain-containing protein n=1 Tax=Kitasatospora setae (strain ATCC 33774 / DSM 43861 / JCM 3304 / KCC A-0304 / NBRC 14216 / KM-6054) TaxID=452652 RepID=E4NGA2_KITSK|nr:MULTISPECIES: hypothetical protein [Kitasatospora]BAJ30532.1 hypothetical protein KSE_47520 [Kitasatospora setae KM-6054]
MSASTPPRAAAPGARRPQSGPPLLAPAVAVAALTVAYTAVNRATPHPDATGAEVVRYAQEHGGAARLGGLLLLAAAVPLALCAAVLYRRLRALGITAPGSAITLVGGVLAAVALVLSAAGAWASGRLPADAPPALGRALADVSFLAGGPAFAAGFGLLAAGVSVSALLAGLLPRAVTWSGLVVAAAGMLSLLALVADGFMYLLPVVRFGGLVWLLFAAALLPLTRRHSNRSDNQGS